MRAWAIAFLFTQLFEMPVYAAALRARRPPARLAIAFAASAITHPIVWFGMLPFVASHYLHAFIAAECFAVVAEALWLRSFGVPRAIAWSLAANATSVVLGFTSRALFGVP